MSDFKHFKDMILSDIERKIVLFYIDKERPLSLLFKILFNEIIRFFLNMKEEASFLPQPDFSPGHCFHNF